MATARFVAGSGASSPGDAGCMCTEVFRRPEANTEEDCQGYMSERRSRTPVAPRAPECDSSGGHLGCCLPRPTLWGAPVTEDPTGLNWEIIFPVIAIRNCQICQCSMAENLNTSVHTALGGTKVIVFIPKETNQTSGLYLVHCCTYSSAL